MSFERGRYYYELHNLSGECIDSLFESAKGSYEGRNEKLGLRWKIGPRSSMVVVWHNNALWSASWLVRWILILIYQFKQFKAPFPEKDSWSYNLQGWLYDISLPISNFLRKLFKIKSPSVEYWGKAPDLSEAIQAMKDYGKEDKEE